MTLVARLGILVRTALLVCAVVSPARAYSASIEWNAPPACSDTEALRHAVERLLGEPLVDGSAVQASATVTEDADGRLAVSLTISTAEDRGTRTVRTDSCQSALDVAAFGIALALNPELRLDPPPTLDAEEAPASPPSAQAPDAPPPPAPPPAPEKTPAPLGPTRPSTADRAPSDAVAPPAAGEVWGAAHAIVDSSLMPAPGLGLGAAVEVVVARRLRFGAGPSLFLPQEARLEGGGGGRFLLWSLQAYGCGTLALRIDVCPLFHYGVLRGEGRGVEPRLAQVSRIVAPGAAVRAAVPLSARIEARGTASALFPLERDVFVVREGEVHRIPRVSLEFSLGIATRAF